jgi:hypothetical protein
VSAQELEELAAERGMTELAAGDSARVQMVARLGEGTHAREGQPLKLWFDPEHLQLFDPATGGSLQVPEPQTAGITPGVGDGYEITIRSPSSVVVPRSA